jgi:hypothetical protein
MNGAVMADLVPPARLELARLAAADFESATSTDFVTGAARLGRARSDPDYHMRLPRPWVRRGGRIARHAVQAPRCDNHQPAAGAPS